MSIIDQVNRTPVTAELLIEANEVHAELPEEDRRDLTGRAVAFIQMLHDKHLSDERRHELLAAMSWRLEALARLEVQGHPEIKGWSMPGHEAGMVFAHHELFKAAATEPLIEVENRPAFDPESFFQRLLDLSEERGHG